MTKKQSHVKSSRRPRFSLASLNLTPDECLRPFLSLLSAFPHGLEPIPIPTLKTVFQGSPFNPEVIAAPRPGMPSQHEFVSKIKAPCFFSRLFGGKTRYINKLTAAREALELHNSRIAQFEQDLLQGEANAVIQYFSIILQRSQYPREIPIDFRLSYTKGQELLTVYRRLPAESVLPAFREYWIDNKNGSYSSVGRPHLYKLVIASIALRTLKELFATDPCSLLQRAIFCGSLADFQNDTPLPEEPHLLSVKATRKEYEQYLAHLSSFTRFPRLSFGTKKPLRVSEVILGYQDPQIDLSPDAIVKETLPYPWVYYPNNYGVFLGFAKDKGSAIALCECSRPAVLNYLRFTELLKAKLIFYPQQELHPIRMWARSDLIDPDFFPPAISEAICLRTDPLSVLQFSPKLCHKCNDSVPSLQYCHPDSGSGFVSRFGWYVNQQYLSYGIFPHELGLMAARFSIFYLLPNIDIPATVREAIECERTVLDEFTILYSSYRLLAATENVVRKEFKVKEIGDAWTSETLLFGMIRQMFPNREVLRHERPAWLNGLELDIYIPSLRLAIEYQGEQHFDPIKSWGGQEALDALKHRDTLKKNLCKKNKIRLVYMNYTDPLTEEYVRKLLEKFIKGKQQSSD